MTEIKSKKGEFARDWIDFLFGFKNTRGEQLDYWISFADAFSYPPQDFYATVEKELAARRFPSLEISREEFAEGGLLSDRRIYLRMFRERLALYACAAPFGTGYWFSCRTVYVPALVRLWHILAAFAFLAAIGRLMLGSLGLTFTLIAVAALVFALGGVFRNAAATGLTDLDAVLLKIPVVSTFYENWFRNDTFYRQDTRVLYLKRVPAIVKELAEEITAEKGAKLVRQNEANPVFGALSKPPPSVPSEKA